MSGASIDRLRVRQCIDASEREHSRERGSERERGESELVSLFYNILQARQGIDSKIGRVFDRHKDKISINSRPLSSRRDSDKL